MLSFHSKKQKKNEEKTEEQNNQTNKQNLKKDEENDERRKTTQLIAIFIYYKLNIVRSSICAMLIVTKDHAKLSQIHFGFAQIVEC